MKSITQKREDWEYKLKNIRADFIMSNNSIEELELMHEYGMKIMQYLAIEIADRRNNQRLK